MRPGADRARRAKAARQGRASGAHGLHSPHTALMVLLLSHTPALSPPLSPRLPLPSRPQAAAALESPYRPREEGPEKEG